MSLFSWFSKQSNAKVNKNCPDTIEKELQTFNNTSMWPIATARKSTVVKQQIYLNEINNKKSQKQHTELKDKATQ